MKFFQGALTIVYVLSWLVVFALMVFIAASYSAHVLHERLSVLPDDDWPLYVWPVGCAFGFWFALRSQSWSRFHYLCLLFGLVATIPFSLQAVSLWRQSQALLGVEGPFSGLAEVIGSLIYSVLAAASGTIAMGSLAIVARNALFPPNKAMHRSRESGRLTIVNHWSRPGDR